MPATLLIVDDSPTQRHFLHDIARRTLGEEGWTILLADSAEEALRLAQEHRSDLGIVLVDAYLTEPPKPEPEGLALLTQIRELNRECFNVLVSSKIADRRKLHADTSFDDFVFLGLTDTNDPAMALISVLHKARKYLWERRSGRPAKAAMA
jgi:response regulator RpfG family c-di-GMP phosphodiesterase